MAPSTEVAESGERIRDVGGGIEVAMADGDSAQGTFGLETK